MIEAGTKDAALEKAELLDEVVRFKRKFYRCSWAKYEKAKIGEISLMPPECSFKALYDDYKHMQNMIFGPKPPFEEILKAISALEKELRLCCKNLTTECAEAPVADTEPKFGGKGVGSRWE